MLRVMCVVAAVMGSAGPARAQSGPEFREQPTEIEKQVLVLLNAARANPAGYAEALRSYRAAFHGKIVSEPGAAMDVETVEGVVPVEEAITFLGHQQPLGTINPGTTLRDAALDHVREQSVSGRTGHFSPEGKGPADRNMKHGGGRAVAEVIAYGATDASEVVRELIVDDGVQDRGHRVVLFARHLKFAGVSCGTHPTFGTMCVIDMADSPDGNG